MHRKLKHIAKRATTIPRLPTVLRSFLKDESIAGKLVISFALLAIVVANSPLSTYYESFWKLILQIGVGDFVISQDLRHWVNEGLMAIFFLVVGLEIKRELVTGELRDRKKAALPVAAAIGGMILPAAIYLAFNYDTSAIRGWGVPIATDIAFAVAVLSLLGRRVPLNLKLFLLSLAIVDDIGAIFVIALFYAEIINFGFLSASLLIIIGLFALRKWMATKLAVFVILGMLLWVTTHLSGVHASIVGAILGLLAPLANSSPNRASINKRLEEYFLPVSTFIALPVFAFANSGIVLSSSVFQHPEAASVMTGIIAGLTIGKLIGISGTAWIMVRFGFAKLPSGVGWMHIVGVSMIAGIGFTVSIFITELAFDGDSLAKIAKISVFIASGIAAVVGSLFLIKAKEIKHILDKSL